MSFTLLTAMAATIKKFIYSTIVLFHANRARLHKHLPIVTLLKEKVSASHFKYPADRRGQGPPATATH